MSNRLTNNVEVQIFYEIGLVILMKVISEKLTKHVHHQFHINDNFAKVVLRPLRRYIANASKDDMQTLYMLIVANKNNSSNTNYQVGTTDCKHLYTFFSILWQDKYINDRKDQYINEISNGFTTIVFDYLNQRLNIMDEMNCQLRILVKHDRQERFVTKKQLKQLVEMIEVNIPIQHVVEIFQEGTLACLLRCVWDVISKTKFNEEREQILMHYAFLETCYRLNRKDVAVENDNKTISSFYKKALMVFKNVDINILNKAISNPEELPSIFYQQSRSILPRSLDEIVDSIIVMILAKCHIDTNDANGMRIRNDMNKLFGVILLL